MHDLTWNVLKKQGIDLVNGVPAFGLQKGIGRNTVHHQVAAVSQVG